MFGVCPEGGGGFRQGLCNVPIQMRSTDPRCWAGLGGWTERTDGTGLDWEFAEMNRLSASAALCCFFNCVANFKHSELIKDEKYYVTLFGFCLWRWPAGPGAGGAIC